MTASLVKATLALLFPLWQPNPQVDQNTSELVDSSPGCGAEAVEAMNEDCCTWPQQPDCYQVGPVWECSDGQLSCTFVERPDCGNFGSYFECCEPTN